MDHHEVLIVGGGHAGAQAAIMLRQLKFGGSITIVSDEPDLPYERPPLSKDYLVGERSFERMLLRPATFWEERDVTLKLGCRVISIDPEAHRVTTGDGTAIGYGQLIWAAGGSARKLAGAGGELAGVHTIRTRADADQLRRELPNIRRAAVIGGGYIGLEAAAALVKLGKEVFLVEAANRLLSRVAGEPLSRFYESEHRAHGVDLRLEANVEGINGAAGRACGVRLSDGSVAPCDLVIVGIGIVPAVAPLVAAGAEGDNGVAVDGQCRTSLADIFAIGDCALHRNRFGGAMPIRLESVQNANDQAAVVAKAISGEAADYAAVPWFWSNQYDLKLQTVGLSAGHDEIIVRGDPEARSFSLVYLRQGRVIALDCVNLVRDYVQGRKLVAEACACDAARLADTSIPLKELA